jgi:uncharacterized coiled-coil DUF342 family protein
VNEDIKETAEKRKGVSDRLKELSQERKEIEIAMVPHILDVFSALKARNEMNAKVKNLKQKRGKSSGKGGKQITSLEKEFKKLEYDWQTGAISHKREKQTMKRLAELDTTLKQMRKDNPGNEVHNQIIETSKKASEAHEKLQKALYEIFLLTDSADGNVLKRERLHFYYKEMSEKLDILYADKKEKTDAGTVSIGDFMDVDSFMEKLKTGETLSLNDLLSMTQE